MSASMIYMFFLQVFFLLNLIIIIQKICSAHIHPAGCSRRESRNTGASPFSFTISVLGSFYVHYTTHRTYSFTSHPKDEAIMGKCLAQGHKRRNRPGRDSNPHSDNTRTWVQCTRPLGHDTPQSITLRNNHCVKREGTTLVITRYSNSQIIIFIVKLVHISLIWNYAVWSACINWQNTNCYIIFFFNSLSSMFCLT